MFSTWDYFAAIFNQRNSINQIWHPPSLEVESVHTILEFFTRQFWKFWRKFWWNAFPNRIKCFISIQNHNTYRAANQHIPFQGTMFQQSNSWNELWETFCRISFLQVIANVGRRFFIIQCSCVCLFTNVHVVYWY